MDISPYEVRVRVIYRQLVCEVVFELSLLDTLALQEGESSWFPVFAEK